MQVVLPAWKLTKCQHFLSKFCLNITFSLSQDMPPLKGVALQPPSTFQRQVGGSRSSAGGMV